MLPKFWECSSKVLLNFILIDVLGGVSDLRANTIILRIFYLANSEFF